MNDVKAKNIDQIREVAHHLAPHLDEMVFLGGAVVALLLTDIMAPDVRPTMDVDVIVGIRNRLQFNKFEAKIRKLGFTQNMDIICRWDVGGVIVDIMPIDKEVLGFSSKWYPAAFKAAKDYHLNDETSVRLIDAPCFLATKIEAFENRGKGDFLMSKDIEDMINVIDGRPEIVKEINESAATVKKFLSLKLRGFLKNEDFLDSIQQNLPSNSAGQNRFEDIVERMGVISKLDKPAVQRRRM